MRAVTAQVQTDNSYRLLLKFPMRGHISRALVSGLPQVGSFQKAAVSRGVVWQSAQQ